MGWSLFCEHKAPSFAAVVGEFYANMVDMKENSVFVRGVWVPLDHKRINEVLQIKDPTIGSKYKKLIGEPNYENVVDFLTTGKGSGVQQRRIPMNPSIEAH